MNYDNSRYLTLKFWDIEVKRPEMSKRENGEFREFSEGVFVWDRYHEFQGVLVFVEPENLGSHWEDSMGDEYPIDGNYWAYIPDLTL